MSTYDFYARRLDPTPLVYKRTGPFVGDESLKTVSAALAFCERHGLDPGKVRLAHNYLMWDAEETPEEVEARIERAKADRRRHVAAIRAMYREYTERGLFAEDVSEEET